MKQKGFAAVVEEIKKKIIPQENAKEIQVGIWNSRAQSYRTLRQNWLFYTNPGKFDKELEKKGSESQKTPAVEEATTFPNNIRSNPVQQRRDAEWLNKVREKTEVDKQSDMCLRMMRKCKEP